MKEVRNLQEQVLYLTEKVKEIMQSLGSALPSPIAGPQGPQGATGEKGPKGEEGYGIRGFGSQLPLSGRNGDWFLIQEQDEGGTNIYAYQRINYHWVRQFSLRGPQGVPGTQGGSEVIVNPEEEATGVINKIKIDGVVYTISVPQDLYVDNMFANDEIELVDPAGDFGTNAKARIKETVNYDSLATTEQIDEINDEINSINDLIPSTATSSNQLADKNFVNSSITTNTANFLGTYYYDDIGVSINERDSQTIGEALDIYLAGENPTNNDYCFYEVITGLGPGDSDIVESYWRYKWDGSHWQFEYQLNNSSFTASQWAAINSGLTASDKTALNGKEVKGKLTIGGTTYDLQIGDTPSAGTITFELED